MLQIAVDLAGVFRICRIQLFDLCLDFLLASVETVIIQVVFLAVFCLQVIIGIECLVFEVIEIVLQTLHLVAGVTVLLIEFDLCLVQEVADRIRVVELFDILVLTHPVFQTVVLVGTGIICRILEQCIGGILRHGLHCILGNGKILLQFFEQCQIIVCCRFFLGSTAGIVYLFDDGIDG